jgi:hypothetical protein
VASARQPAIVIGHVASLTTGISALCRNGPGLWGTPLPHAIPFPLTCRGAHWHVQWPGTQHTQDSHGQPHQGHHENHDLRLEYY